MKKPLKEVFEDKTPKPSKLKLAEGDLVPLSTDHFHSHFPADDRCEVCRHCKLQRVPCRKGDAKAVGHGDLIARKPTKFGDSITTDHAILNELNLSKKGDKVALIIQDRFSKWLACYPSASKSADETERALRKLMGQIRPGVVYADGSLEFE